MALLKFEPGVSLDSEYDWTIIGCGAVGILSALRLVEDGNKVLVLESGQHGERAEYQALNQGAFNREDIASSATWGRKRALGGTTIRWGGQALPFRQVDFTNRKSDLGTWLLEASDLEEDYKHAEKFMRVGHLDYWDVLESQSGNLRIAEGLQYHYSKWAPEPNMFKVHGRRLCKVADVLMGAHVLEPIVEEKDGSSRIASLRVGSLEGFQQEIPVRNVILANGGMESTRFMVLHGLSSAQLLGKGFMEHPCADLGVCRTRMSLPLQRQFGTRMIKGKKYSVRLSLSEALEEKEQFLASSASLMFEENTGQTPSPLTRIRRVGKGNLKELWGLIQSIPDFLIAAREYLCYGIAYRPHPSIRITVMAEQGALSESQIGIDEKQLDHFGQPRIKINWTFDQRTLDSVRRLAGLVKETLESNEFLETEVELADWLERDDFSEFQDEFNSVNHHMGGAVMGREDDGAVVDDQLRVYGMENLRLFSSAVFPSSSHSNPTLTAMALAHRSLRILKSNPRPIVPQ